MNKIAIVCPYFGKLPSNINITINSMKNNDFIDWYILTDDDISFEKYENIFFEKWTFEKMKKLIKNKIGTKLYNPYKLCDYKVTYGYLFEDKLKKYEFWGFCDLDVVFGNLALVFNYENLEKYHKIFDKGHISIFKNIKEINEAFMKTNLINKDYKLMLNSQYIYCFDERYPNNHLAINEIIEKMGYLVLNNIDTCFDIDIKYRNFYNVDKKKIKNIYFQYKNKKLFTRSLKGDNKEIIYAHFQKKHIPICLSQYNDFYITPKLVCSNIKVTNKYFYFFDFKAIWYIKFRLNRKIKNIKRNMCGK